MIKGFPVLLEDYVLSYLPKERGLAKATVISYYAALEQYVFWLRDIKGHALEKVGVLHFHKTFIREFLGYLEREKQVSAATRNLRKAGILSFLCFAADVEPVYMNAFLEAKSIRDKKAPKPKRDFLGVEEYRTLMESITLSEPEGFKHYVLLNTLYETAARVSEVVWMDIENFSFGRENSVVIYGKGSKYRRVYINGNAAMLIKDFCNKMSIEKGALFRNRSGKRMTDSGIDYIIKKYTALAAKGCPSLKWKKVSPHTLRRTKATHMLLNGISLPVIQRFLGHESISTTETYLELGTKAMIEAVEKVEKLIFNPTEINVVKEWDNNDVMTRLKKLIK